jgi:signal transduction histidine kinase
MELKETMRVLIVEDDFMVSKMIQGRLEQAGYRVLGEAANGRQAVEMVRSLRPDVVLMDIEMPEMDGIEATRLIYEACPTPVVMLTAYQNPELVRQASEAGAGAYLIKLPQTGEIQRAITVATTRFEDMMALHRLNSELDAFAHTVAHDLQNPLNLIINYAELLKSELILSDEQQKYFNGLVRNAHRMDRIIDELLLLAGARKVEVELRPLNMGRIVAEVQQRLAYLIAEYQAEFSLPDQWPQALGHAPWIEEVWANYLSNGMQHGGRPPRLKLGATERSDGMIRFWVRDNGPGLSPEAQAQLFTPFIRLDHIRATGYGLGLSIVKRIVERLGGQVGVESEGIPGKGSTFFFTLPANRY